MKIFLTGGSGFIGQNFCQLVTKKGHYVYAISRKKKRNKNENIKWLLGDLSTNWKKELSNSDILVHMAASGINKNNTITLGLAFHVNVIFILVGV